MIEDPIVEELHKIREEMPAEHGGLEGLVKHLPELQAEMPSDPTLTRSDQLDRVRRGNHSYHRSMGNEARAEHLPSPT